jgi:hypothetical protein
VAIACFPSALAVVDVDPRNGGDDSLAELEHYHGPLPATWRAHTGSGGFHVIFQAPADVGLVDGPLAPGIDLKANGYIVAPPSMHPNGRVYVWELGSSPDDVPLAPTPAWLVALINGRPRRRAPQPGAPLIICTGKRNVELFRLACRWRRDGIGEAALFQMLRAVNDHHVQPPLGPFELQRIAASAGRYAPARRADAKA